MTKADEIFLTLFKDLKIRRDELHPGPDELPNYQCILNGRCLKHREVVKMVKDYQDAVIQSLMER